MVNFTELVALALAATMPALVAAQNTDVVNLLGLSAITDDLSNLTSLLNSTSPSSVTLFDTTGAAILDVIRVITTIEVVQNVTEIHNISVTTGVPNDLRSSTVLGPLLDALIGSSAQADSSAIVIQDWYQDSFIPVLTSLDTEVRQASILPATIPQPLPALTKMLDALVPELPTVETVLSTDYTHVLGDFDNLLRDVVRTGTGVLTSDTEAASALIDDLFVALNELVSQGCADLQGGFNTLSISLNDLSGYIAELLGELSIDATPYEAVYTYEKGQIQRVEETVEALC